MRKLTGAVFQSLDGVMQAPGGPEEDPTSGFRFGGWVFPFWDESLEPFGGIFETEYDLLLGKRTYDIFSGYWPHNQDIPIGATFQRINKYVLTHSHERLSWDNSHKLSGDTAEAVAELKRSGGRDLLIQGSSTLYAPLLAAGLIDRLLVMVFPVVLGQGKRIFDGPQAHGTLKLTEHAVSDKGVLSLGFEPAGEVRTGSFETKEPSEAELERRKAWAREEA
jgi:dihydrofolate reductase